MKVVLDACVLYPTIMREILVGLAQEGGFVPIWSTKILSEWQHAAARGGEAVKAQSLVEIALLKASWPKAAIDIDNHDLEGFWLPDPDDRHVLAAAVAGRADCIVTMNLKDFPSRVLGRHDLYVRHPDAFLLEIAQTGALDGVIRTVWQKSEQISQKELVLRNLLKRTGLPRLGRHYEHFS